MRRQARSTSVPIAGDGSDRRWHRVSSPDRHSLIVADHGIHSSPDVRGECEAFVAIGRHLYEKGISVPRIYQADAFAGLAVVEDLGDRTSAVRGAQLPESPRKFWPGTKKRCSS